MKKVQITKVTTTEDCDRIHAVQLLLKIMKIIGLWQWLPPSLDINPSLANTVRVLHTVQKYILHIPITFTFVTLMWIEALRANDVSKAGDVLYMGLTEAVMIVKILNIWHYSERASRFIHELAYHPEFALHTVEEVRYWQQSQRRFRNVVYIFFSGSVLTVVFGFVGVLFLKEPQIPYGYWIPFEWRTIPRNYWLVYLYDMLGMLLTMVSNVCLDMMGCYMMSHVASLYRILSFRLRKLEGNNEAELNLRLLNLLRFHRNIRRKSKECETLTSYYTLAQITLSALILCFCAYRILKMNISETFGEFFSMIYFLGVMILEIFLPCYFANEIIVNSSELATDIYSCDWQNFPLKTQKIIFIYMEFLKHPDQLKAGGYFQVGLPIFTNVINNAYKGFALLMNVAK